jgi:hypothetical protein
MNSLLQDVLLMLCVGQRENTLIERSKGLKLVLQACVPSCYEIG